MNRIEQIKVEQKKLADELESEMLKERANVLAKIKEDIKLFGFKTSDFKGVLIVPSLPLTIKPASISFCRCLTYSSTPCLVVIEKYVLLANCCAISS